jgi:translocator protein
MNLRALALFVGATFVAALAGGAFPPGVWYAGLTKPSWNPPNWVFGPVWTLLYAGIAAAGYRTHQKQTKESAAAMSWWWLQLALNAGWSLLFFGAKLPSIAFIEIVFMLASILVFAAKARRVDKLSGLLFVPYACWVSFAAFLTSRFGS